MLSVIPQTLKQWRSELTSAKTRGKMDADNRQVGTVSNRQTAVDVYLELEFMLCHMLCGLLPALAPQKEWYWCRRYIESVHCCELHIHC